VRGCCCTMHVTTCSVHGNLLARGSAGIAYWQGDGGEVTVLR